MMGHLGPGDDNDSGYFDNQKLEQIISLRTQIAAMSKENARLTKCIEAYDLRDAADAADQISALRTQIAALTTERGAIRQKTLEECEAIARMQDGTGLSDWSKCARNIADAIAALRGKEPKP